MIIDSRGANLLADLLLDPEISDLTGSFRLYKKQAFQQLAPECHLTGYVFQLEIIVRARQHRYIISEVPIAFVDRIYGQSKCSVHEIANYLRGLWALLGAI
jgi:dolichol-phosphate mannosyltransferase